jgi:DNA-binding NarL/FixJ family response regulator
LIGIDKHFNRKIMSIEEAKAQLAVYRQEQRMLRKRIEGLRKFLREQGVDPDPPAVDLRPRNKAIYGLYLDGKSYADIAKEYKLSAARIKDICQREEIFQAKAARRKQTED